MVTSLAWRRLSFGRRLGGRPPWRIAYLDLTPFLLPEVAEVTILPALWSRGRFPDSLLAGNDADSLAWREDFVRTFVERDIPSLGLAVPAPVMARLWRLLAHYHGQIVNYSKLAALGGLALEHVGSKSRAIMHVGPNHSLRGYQGDDQSDDSHTEGYARIPCTRIVDVTCTAALCSHSTHTFLSSNTLSNTAPQPTDAAPDRSA